MGGTADDQKLSQVADFKKFQNKYLISFYIATFSDWIQGSYGYKVYEEYRFDDKTIALLYVMGYWSSLFFGTVVGYLGDRFGRKLMCMVFSVTYSINCVCKLSTDFYVLSFGRFMSGIATSILCSMFEAWYVNEHINHFQYPSSWLSETFSKATFGSGVLAIISGGIAYVLADVLHLGPISPSLFAVPCLTVLIVLIYFTWEEHPTSVGLTFSSTSVLCSLKLIFTDPCLFTLCIVESLMEGVMYTFVFAWTPVLNFLSYHLGLVFSVFMISFMCGSKLYAFFYAKLHSDWLLIVAVYLAAISASAIAIFTSSIFNTQRTLAGELCFCAFVLYELSIGLYSPCISYLRCTLIPETGRATIINWLRVPINIITVLTLGFVHNKGSSGSKELGAIHSVCWVCTVCLVVAFVVSILFRLLYKSRLLLMESTGMQLPGLELISYEVTKPASTNSQ